MFTSLSTLSHLTTFSCLATSQIKSRARHQKHEHRFRLLLGSFTLRNLEPDDSLSSCPVGQTGHRLLTLSLPRRPQAYTGAHGACRLSRIAISLSLLFATSICSTDPPGFRRDASRKLQPIMFAWVVYVSRSFWKRSHSPGEILLLSEAWAALMLNSSQLLHPARRVRYKDTAPYEAPWFFPPSLVHVSAAKACCAPTS